MSASFGVLGEKLWEFSHPGAEQQQQQHLRVSGGRGGQAASQHADCHFLPFSDVAPGDSLPYWEPLPQTPPGCG